MRLQLAFDLSHKAVGVILAESANPEAYAQGREQGSYELL